MPYSMVLMAGSPVLLLTSASALAVMPLGRAAPGVPFEIVMDSLLRYLFASAFSTFSIFTNNSSTSERAAFASIFVISKVKL